MSFIPMQSNPYVQFGNSANEMFLELLNPFSYSSTLAIQIVSPLFPTYDDTLGDEPEYGLDDFLVWGKAFEEYLSEGEDSFLYPLFYALTILAKLRVRWTIIGEENIWKQMVSLYIAHYLELNIDLLKDEANRISLNAYEKDKDHKFEMEVGGKVFEDFKTTKYGRIFWFLWSPYGRMQIWGVL